MINEKENRDIEGIKRMMSATLLSSRSQLYAADKVLLNGVPGSKEYITAERNFAFEKHWMEDEVNRDYIFSFPNICETLGLDPTKVRERIYKGLEAKTEE